MTKRQKRSDRSGCKVLKGNDKRADSKKQEEGRGDRREVEGPRMAPGVPPGPSYPSQNLRFCSEPHLNRHT